jgi:Phosphatidylglycerophosphate synthase
MNRPNNIPNIISCSRCIAAIGLLFTSVFSLPFWILYVWCGVSDMIDGALARKMGATSNLGAKIDSIADLMFVVIAFAKVIPALTMPFGLWVIIGIIAVLQIVRMSFLYFRNGGWNGLHDKINKIVGLILYLVPFAVFITIFSKNS